MKGVDQVADFQHRDSVLRKQNVFGEMRGRSLKSWVTLPHCQGVAFRGCSPQSDVDQLNCAPSIPVSSKGGAGHSRRLLGRSRPIVKLRVKILDFAWIGGAGGIRTPDLFNAIEALSQLSYSPMH